MIRKIHCFVLMALMSATGFSQPYEVGHTSRNFIDAQRANRNVPVQIYYPAPSQGDDVPMAVGQFPVLSFGHGFVMGYGAYENIWTSLVPLGFVVVLPETEGGLSPSHLEFAKDLNFVIAHMQVLNGDPESLFFDRISTQSAVMGHSMGGGAAILAAGMNPGLDGLAVLAPAETNPSAIEAGAGVSVPALIFAGANDCVTPPATNQLPMYQSLAGSCKTYIAITGGSHCQMAEYNFLCSFGEITCSPSAEIGRDEQHSIIDGYLGNWLKAQLIDDCEAGNSFDQSIATDGDIEFERNCLLCNPLSTIETLTSGVTLYPNPVGAVLNIDVPQNLGGVRLSIYDLSMREVFAENLGQTAVVPMGFLKEGLYLYKVSRLGKPIKSGKILKILTASD